MIQEIKVPIFDYVVWVVVDTSPERLKEFLTINFNFTEKGIHDNELIREKERCSAYTISGFHSGHSIVVFTERFNTKDLVHELFHVICDIARTKGFTLTDDSEEVYAYLFDWLYSKIKKKVKKSNKKQDKEALAAARPATVEERMAEPDLQVIDEDIPSIRVAEENMSKLLNEVVVEHWLISEDNKIIYNEPGDFYFSIEDDKVFEVTGKRLASLHPIRTMDKFMFEKHLFELIGSKFPNKHIDPAKSTIEYKKYSILVNGEVVIDLP